MKRAFPFRKRSLATLVTAAILLCAMFFGIQALPLLNTASGAPASLLPAELQRAFPNSAPKTSSADENAFSNVHSNLMDYLRTGEASGDLRSSSARPEVMITAGLDVDFKELATHMWIRNVFTLGFGYIIQGFVNTAKDLAIISAMSSVGTITGNPYLAYNEKPSDTPATDQFRAREIMGIDEVLSMYPDFNGTGITIGICDTGTDFGVTDLATAYDTEGGVPTSFDPGGTGLAITSFSLPARRRGGGAGDYLLIADLDFTLFRGEGPALPTSSGYGFELQDMLVGGVHPITSQSGYYQVGMSVQNAAGMPRNRAFFIYILVDSTTAGIYDTLYIDFETSFALTAEYNGISTWITADWDFTNNARHRWGDGTEVLAEDFDFDGVNDYSMGMLSNTYDLFGLMTGSLVSGIDPDGLGFAVMYDYDGHGTGTAGAAAGRGLTGFDVYGNGTLYTVTGAAPGATIMALKLFTWGDFMDTWLWGCGFDPISWDESSIYAFSNWTYTGDHKADILSNSWGFLDFYLLDGGLDMVWGYDWYSNMVDFLSYWTDTLFCISSGNTGPGYGTGSSPYAVSALMVGASTTAHVWQPLYGDYPQGYDTMADFSSSGPAPSGSGNPSVVAVGAYAFDVYALHYGQGDGLEAWTAFGGTSQACPLAAGVAAIVMQAMDYSGLPYSSGGLVSSIAKTIVMNGADDLGYDVYRQGAGRVNAFKAINLAFGNETDGTNDLLSIGTMETFDQIYQWDRQCPARGWYQNMYYGWDYAMNIFDYTSFYHPGAEYGPDTGVWDGGAFPHPIYRGDAYSFNVTASVGTMGASGVDALDAYTYAFTQQASELLVSTSTYTTFNLTKEFGTSFMADFYAADYATIMLTYPDENFDQIYGVTGTAPYVFLHDWMEDLNANGMIDLTNPVVGSIGEVRRIAADTSYSNCHQINLGYPGSLFQAWPTLYYHDVGIEAFAWRSMNVNVTIRLYDRVAWSWITTSQYGVGDPNYPYMWQVTATIPGDATPGFYEGFLQATTATGETNMPLSIRVDANMDSPGPAGAVSWGGTQGTIYDNGATYGGLNYGYREQCGDWRFYFVDAYPYAYSAPPGGTPPPSWYLVNVTWTDPDTCLDVFIYYSGYGYWFYSSTFEWVGDRGAGYWAGTPTATAQNILLEDVSFPGVAGWQYTRLSRGLIGIALRTSAFGGHTGGPEDFQVTVSYSNTNHADYPASAWASPANWMNVTYPTTYGGQAIVAGSTYSGPAVTFKGNWTQLSIADFPALKIQETDLQVNKVQSYTWYGSFVETNCTADSPSQTIDAIYVLPGVAAGSRIDVHMELNPDPGDHLADLELFLIDPTGTQVASSTNSYSIEDIVNYIALLSGDYQIFVSYWGVDTGTYYYWGGWSSLPFVVRASAALLSHSITTGLASSRDTGAMGNAVGLDVVLKGLTGTSLDSSAFLEAKVANIAVTNRFAPTVHVDYPNGGELVGPGTVTLNWTGLDRNVDEWPYDEVLSYTVEISNDSGASWKLVIFETGLDHGTWNPQSAFYGLPAGSQFLMRVNVTDGVYSASDTSDAVWTLKPTTTTTSVSMPYELITIVIVAVVVIVILLTTCLLKRRQTRTK